MVFSTTTFALAALLVGVLVEAQPQVPCIFFFGDSLSDNGNNNDLLTGAKVNYPPYGIDFPGGPTGRFANGPNLPDYLAQLLGFENPVPPFATAIKDSNVVKGANYASGGVGILDETGAQLGDLIPMNEQLANHENVISRIASVRRSNVSSDDYLTKCLYVVNIGSNDFINNYYLPFSPARMRYTPDRFAQLLIEQLTQQLTKLYNNGARKVAVYGLGRLGTGAQIFNDLLKPLVGNLNNQLRDALFTYINIASISSVTFTMGLIPTPCCALAPTGTCIPNSVPCANRDQHALWDSVHPSSVVDKAVAARVYTAASPDDAYPVDIQHLVQL